jgi:phosphoserine aminotransferase
MNKSVQWQILAIIILVAIAIVDALSVFIPIAAGIGIALVLFKPKWLFKFFKTLYFRGGFIMRRVFNFSAGPSMLQEEILLTAQEEMLNYRGSGMSVMEMSHRSEWFAEIIDDTEKTLREIMEIPKNYRVLFLQGGASTQFAMIPLNLFSERSKADYVITGAWSKKAAAEAAQFGTVILAASSEDRGFSYIPSLTADDLSKDADYIHITTNNTIYGTRYPGLPDTGTIPLVADMSSSILSERYDVSRFGLIYAGAQKNIGPAGLTLVIIREDLIGHALEGTPTMLRYETHVEKGSMFNTPPCFAIYIAGLTFKFIQEQGGVAEMEKRNREKAGLLYDFIESSAMFTGTVERPFRSLMNVTFTLPSDELTQKCIAEAADHGLVTLKGHRSVGGMRASLYNAMPTEGIRSLVAFLREFEHENL